MNNNEFIRTENLPFEVDETIARRKPYGNKNFGKIIVVRALISAALLLVLAFSLMWTYAYTVVHGPSARMKEEFVCNAYEKASTKWIPHLVLPSAEIDAIIEGRVD